MSLPSINLGHLTISEILPQENFKGQSHYSNIKDQIKVTPQAITHLHSLTNTPTRYQLPIPSGSNYSSHYSKVKVNQNQHPPTPTPTNNPTKYPSTTAYCFLIIAQTRF